MNIIKKILKIILSDRFIQDALDVKNIYLDNYSVKSYSQEGEDMILRRVFGDRKTGFYVDVGAHHPFRFSNTYYFYRQGWRGINIDALPGSMRKFKRYRSEDINLEMPISNTEQVHTYYSFNEPALNTFSKELALERNGRDGYYIREELKLSTSKLSTVLDRYIPEYVKIDFLSIDVEGFDLDVLKSNDWDKYKPDYILAEIIGGSLHEIENTELALFLKNHSYVVFAKAIHSVIFKLKAL